MEDGYWEVTACLKGYDANTQHPASVDTSVVVVTFFFVDMSPKFGIRCRVFVDKQLVMG